MAKKKSKKKKQEKEQDEPELDDGPDIDPETGVYRPARYKTSRGNIREDF